MVDEKRGRAKRFILADGTICTKVTCVVDMTDPKKHNVDYRCVTADGKEMNITGVIIPR